MIFGGKIGGSVRVIVKGDCGEDLLGVLAKKDIPLWDIRREENGNISFSVEISNVLLVRQEALAMGCHIVLGRREGLPFLWKGMKRRKASWFTAIFVFLALWCVLSTLWTTEVVLENGETIDAATEKKILAAAEECGLDMPLWKADLDPKTVSAALLERCPYLSWVGVSAEGMTLVIHVAERKSDPKENTVCGHIVAEKSGVIRRILVLKGQKQVEVGDTVKKGEVLISGDMVYEEEGRDPVYRQTSAKGTVLASVWYEGVAYVKLEDTVAIPTGDTAGVITVSKGEKKWILWGNEKNPFKDFTVKEYSFTLFGWEICSKTYEEAEMKRQKVSEKTAKKQAEKKAGQIAEKQVPKDAVIVDRKTAVLRDEKGALGIKVSLECNENIGTFMSLP